MFDFHNHFTVKDSILLTGLLLPQNYQGQDITKEISNSEFGLDKRYTNVMPKEKQIELCEKCLQVARTLNIPVQIHCVGFTEEMIKLLTKYQLKKQFVIWHHFTGSIETAKILKSLGVIISIGPTYNKDLKALYEANNLLVLETDYTGASLVEHNKIIEDNYNKVAKELNLDLQTLEELVLDVGKAFTHSRSIGK